MTQEQFINQEWREGMKCNYLPFDWMVPEPFWIWKIDTREKLIGIVPEFLEPSDFTENDIRWVRCENVTLINQTI